MHGCVSKAGTICKEKENCAPVASRIPEATNPNCRPAQLCHYLHSESFWLRLATQLPPMAANVGKSEVKKGTRNSNQQKRDILE